MSSPVRKLQAHLQNLNADNATMIRSYWDTTGLKIGIISDLLNMRDLLEHQKNPELYRKFKETKKDVITYLGQKLTNPAVDQDSDLWFEILTIAKHQFSELRETVKTDIRNSSWNESKKSQLIDALDQERYQDLAMIRYS